MGGSTVEVENGNNAYGDTCPMTHCQGEEGQEAQR
jgi:hypothetical protein